jgi:hypothetical protein
MKVRGRDSVIEGTTALRVCERDVTYERLDGEVIAVNLLSGRYYSMSGSAADSWTAVITTENLIAAANKLQNAYENAQDISESLSAFIAACVAAGLLEEVSETDSRSIAEQLPDDFDRGGWAPPLLEEYEDLQDLILVDPVHDTSALGWPHVEDERL